MGVAGLWDIIRPAGRTRSLTELAVVEGFTANPDGVRGFRIGIDASIWFFHAEYGKEGENPVLRTLFFRCATLMHSPFLPLFVFDGPRRPAFKRGKKIKRTGHKLIPGMKAIVESFGFEWRMAPGEAEAELAYLNRIGVIDGILSDDVDNFLFGATMILRNPSNNLSGNRANPILNAAGKDDKNHTKVYRLADITKHPDILLTRGGMILVGLMSGGDYQQGGVARCGTVTAHGLAKCGFGDTLYEAAINLHRDDLPTYLVQWRHELRHELRTNSRGYIGRKHPALADSLPETFPDIDILLSYTNPITSESMGRTEDSLKPTWGKDPDLGKLAATCEFYFEWGYKEAIIKRFRNVIWPSAVLRILRREVLDRDKKAGQCGEILPPSTPRKTQALLESDFVESPSRMMVNRFSSMSLGALGGHSSGYDDDQGERLIVKVHSARNHVSVDGILEYRLEIAPAKLVRIAESGIKGIRVPEGPDEWAEEEEEAIVEKGAKKLSPDPKSHMRVWMPASIVEMAEPRLVEEYEVAQGRRRSKKARERRSESNGSKTMAKLLTNADGLTSCVDAEEILAPLGDGGNLPTTKPIRGNALKSFNGPIKTLIPLHVSPHQDSAPEPVSFKHMKAQLDVRNLTKEKFRTKGLYVDTPGSLNTSSATTTSSNNSKTIVYAKPAQKLTNSFGPDLGNKRDIAIDTVHIHEFALQPSSGARGRLLSKTENVTKPTIPKGPFIVPTYKYPPAPEYDTEERSIPASKSRDQRSPAIPPYDTAFVSDGSVAPITSKQARDEAPLSCDHSKTYSPKFSGRNSSRPERASTYSRYVNNNKGGCGTIRSCSPPPLRPTTRSARAAVSPPSPIIIRAIEISSDSDAVSSPTLNTIRPLMLARARAKASGKSKPLSQIAPKHSVRVQENAKVAEDIIDLT